MNTYEPQNTPSYEPPRPAGSILPAEPLALSRRALRKVLNRALAIPSQVDAFLIDFYPQVYQQTSSGMDREGKLNLLLAYVPEAQLTRLLRAEYAQELMKFESQCVLGVSHPNDEKRSKYTIVLSASISEMDVHKVYALVNHLRKYTDDSELTIEQIRSGSVIVTCAGREDSFTCLYNDFTSGRLSKLVGYPVWDIVLCYEPKPRHLDAIAAPLRQPRLLPAATRTMRLSGEMVTTLHAPQPGNRNEASPRSPAISMSNCPWEAGRLDLSSATAAGTALTNRIVGRKRLGVLVSLCVAASVAIVAVLGDGQIEKSGGPSFLPARRRIPASPAVAEPGSPSPASSDSDMNDDPLPPSRRRHFAPVRSISKPAPQGRHVAPETSEEKSEPHSPGLAPEASEPAGRSPAKFRSHSSLGPISVDMRCAGAIPCNSARAEEFVTLCWRRFAPDFGHGSLTFSRVGIEYEEFGYQDAVPGYKLRAFVRCWQDVMPYLFGSDPARWPTQLQIKSKPPAGK